MIGFQASHERFAPSALRNHLTQAAQAGFAALCSDHCHLWTHHHGQSGYSFARLGAALQRSKLSLGTICGGIHDLETSQEMADATREVRPEDLRESLRISSDLGQRIAWLASDFEQGVERVYLHPVGGHPERFLETFGTRVLPQFSVANSNRKDPS